MALAVESDSIPVKQGLMVKKSIYPQELKKKGRFYNMLWGKHYRKLYYTPITVNTKSLKALLGEKESTGLANDFYGLFLKNTLGHNYLLKPIGGSSSFLKSDFFQEMYNKEDFKDTYLDQFIGDAYTIINPYTFLASDYMAKMAGLNSSDPSLYYIPPRATTDTIMDGSDIQDRLVSVCLLPDTVSQSDIITTPTLLSRIQADKSHKVDQAMYIRERLFDILIGDWNKIPENWVWIMKRKGKETIYEPVVIDRSHAFTKVDGLLSKQMLGVLSLSFIADYDEQVGNVKTINKLGFTTDVALTAQSKQREWVNQSEYLKRILTNDVIDKAFSRLPKEVQGAETDEIKTKLKKRRDQLTATARKYYKDLQFNPLITGTAANDTFVIDRFSRDSIRISIYNESSSNPVFSQEYTKKNSKEIWVYGLDGDDTYKVTGKFKNKIPLYLLGGKGDNHYDTRPGNKLKIFGYKSQKADLEAIKEAKVVFTDNDNIHNYDYRKTRYKDISFSPWGIYDSDWGLSLGSFVSYTRYGLKRSPFSYQHRIGYNYLRGFMYKGIFPMYDERRSIYLDAFIGSPANFSNFFGFGNNTDRFKESKKNYNRVKIGQYSIAPSFHYALCEGQQIIVSSAFELFKIGKTTDRFINQYYQENNSLFDAKYFADFGLSYEVDTKLSGFVPVFTAALSAGWKLNIGDFGRNYPYTEARMSFNFRFSDRLTLATQMKGRVLFNDKYEFYQSASTELRGYRDNRFVGRQSYSQSSDLRLDMGKIKNPFTPLKYGLFAGFDFGRVWYPQEASKKWHTSYGGGAWVTIINKITTKYSCFGSGDDLRFMFGLGMGF
ncbi:hypothetical protein [Dysgonomonas sp. Marseille-P4677]|uniref:hypothetical protein n=1 Tax=Dysgonomonas sp. Marseille-P4677 TaxID=2364790 RepID=UPI00351BF0C3